VRRTLDTSGLNKPRQAEQRKDLLQSFDESLDPRIVPLVEEALRDEWIIVREAACKTLGKVRDHDAVPALIEALQRDDSMDVRRAAGLALGSLADVRAVEPLLQLLVEAPPQRPWVLEAITRIGPAAVPVLTARLRHDDPGYRLDAVVLLGKIKVLATLPHLTRALHDPQPIVRAHAAEALGWLEAPEASAEVARLLNDDDPSVRTNAAAALLRIADPRTASALTQALGDLDPSVRGFAASALGKIREASSVDVLLVMLTVEEPENRLRVVEALGEIRDPQTVEPLVRCLTDSELTMRVKVAEALGKIGSPNALPALVCLLNDPNLAVRREAVEALEQIGDPQSVGVLGRILEYDRASEVRLAAARALGRLRDPRGIPALQSVLQENTQLCIRACVALGEIGTSEIIGALVPLLDDSLPEVRYHAAVSLGNSGDTRVLKSLERLLQETDPFVLRGLGKALQQLGDPRSRRILERAKEVAAQPDTSGKITSRNRLSGAARSGLRLSAWLMPDSLIGIPAHLLRSRAGTAVVATLLVGVLAAGWVSWGKFSNRHATARIQRGKVAHAVFGPDDVLTLITTGGDIEFWDTSKSQLAQRLAGKAKNTQRVLITSDGKRLICTGANHELLVLDRDQTTAPLKLSGHKSPVIAWSLIEKEQQLCSVSKDGTVITWNLTTGKARDSLQLPADGLKCAALADDGELIAAGLNSGQVKLFSVSKAKEVAELGAHKKSVDAVAFSRDGQLLASMAADGSLAVWNTETRELRHELQAPQSNSQSITLLHFSPQGDSLAVGQLDGVVQLWDLAQQKRTDLIAEFPGRSVQRLERIDSLAFSHDGHLLAAAGSENRQVAMWEVASHKSLPALVPAN
jgi:HEAT repeat protein